MSEILKGLTNKQFTSHGYQELPGGLILQWQYCNVTQAGTAQGFDRPKPFPNACLMEVVSEHTSLTIHPVGVASAPEGLDNRDKVWLLCTVEGGAAGQVGVISIGY